jgi:hypothetical protein
MPAGPPFLWAKGEAALRAGDLAPELGEPKVSHEKADCLIGRADVIRRPANWLEFRKKQRL